MKSIKVVKYTFVLLILLMSVTLKAQDINVLLKEAENFEHSFKEPDALNKYKEVLAIDAKNMKALIKAAELSCCIGNRSANKSDKRLNYESGLSFAKRALGMDSNSADANYAMAMMSGKMTEVETENKLVVAYVRDCKNYADKALKINPNHAKANFTEGRWHYEMVTLNSFKRLAANVIYGGVQAAKLDSAIYYLEKCRSIDPYYMIDYYYLNKAYKEDYKIAKQIEILTKMSKLPTRTFDDVAMKAEANKLLAELE